MGKISAGSFDLNKWLYGGYERGVITMIAGPPGSGKTNLALLVSCSQAKKDKKVIFVDTEGGFSADRIKQICGENYKDILKNILLLEPTTFDEQKKSFTQLLNTVKKRHVNLIVIDGMAMLYRLELGDAIEKKDSSSEKIMSINREMAKQMRILAELARKQNISVIITNQVYKVFSSDTDWKDNKEVVTNIVGGDLFKYWSKCIIELKNDNGRRKAVLLKHRSLDNKDFNFIIRDKGIFKKSWI